MRGGARPGSGRPPVPTGTAIEGYIQARVDKELKKEFKIWCKLRKVDMSEFIKDIITDYIRLTDTEYTQVKAYIKELREEKKDDNKMVD